jgi:hypothetical protein
MGSSRYSTFTLLVIKYLDAQEESPRPLKQNNGRPLKPPIYLRLLSALIRDGRYRTHGLRNPVRILLEILVKETGKVTRLFIVRLFVGWRTSAFSNC